MTAQEQDLIRIRAWDDYLAAKNKFHACRVLLEQWGKALRAVGNKLVNYPATVIEQDFVQVPSHPTFAKALEDFQLASNEFKRAWISARDFGFTVGQHDLNELGGA
jgi:hypothetical protein